jgi:hypothetical protein
MRGPQSAPRTPSSDEILQIVFNQHPKDQATADRLPPTVREAVMFDRCFGVFVITLTYLHVLRGAAYSWDFPISDGWFYFTQAHDWARDHFALSRDWSPLYVMVYSLFHLLWRQHLLMIYIVHRAVTLYAASLVVWLIGCRLFSTNVATVIAVGFMANPVFLQDFHVNSVATFVFVAVVLYVASRTTSGRALAVLALLLCGRFIRTELVLALTIFATLNLRHLFSTREGKLHRRETVALLLCSLLVGYCQWRSYTPPGPSRAFQAFSQQSLWTYLRSTGQSANLGHWDYYAYTKRLYGDVETVPAAMVANPIAFVVHLGRNATDLPHTLAAALTPTGAHGAALVFLVLYLAAIASGRRTTNDTRVFWKAAAAIAFGAIAVCLVFSSGARYVLPATAPIMFGLTWLLLAVKDVVGARSAGSSILVRVLLVVFVVLAPQPFRNEVGRPVVHFSTTLSRTFDVGHRNRVYAFAAASYCTYLTSLRHDQCVPVEPDRLSTARNLADLLQASDIDAVVLSVPMREFLAQRVPNELRAFEQDARTFGFAEVQHVPDRIFGGEAVLYVRGPSPARSRLFFDASGQYRYVGTVDVGPIAPRAVLEPGATFPASSASFNHWLIGVDGGVRF